MNYPVLPFADVWALGIATVLIGLSAYLGALYDEFFRVDDLRHADDGTHEGGVR